MRPLETMLFAVGCISGLGPFIQLRPAIGENEPNVDLRLLVFDKQMLCSISDRPDPFRLKEPNAAFLGKFKVGRVSSNSRRYDIINSISLVEDLNFVRLKLLSNGLLEAATVSISEASIERFIPLGNVKTRNRQRPLC